ncbi:MAG: GntR family transcriptional regulator [Cypionkella sp.]|uniref:GntR family transcriptional regulator n=1 Tax=Cypionkella sp. TaxID=2811411 RepID=UPI002ABBD78A|nr:GntR family transcriptional regulator [Cypionkella sp.]MDZ4313070.1 GntR family transcriptional regulator [Cypionkella sp.]MDZ4395262.1 GntR family transcriptional regulator [Cypionkella sp.]
MSDMLHLDSLEHLTRPSVADQVFDALRAKILALDLPPSTKLSEVDVARQMGVSRQPVRDAFYRLSKLGFISIRPQRSTTVSQISTNAVMQARFIRAAIEAQTVRVACDKLTPADHAALRDLLDLQRAAMTAKDPLAFHALDDQFHRDLCERAGCGFAWEIIRENKSHMDRVRFLSLSFASQDAFGDHVAILDAIEARDAASAMSHMQLHLGRIRIQIERIRADNQSYFATEVPCIPDS